MDNFSLAQEAHELLARKFGPLLTKWVPTRQNVIFFNKFEETGVDPVKQNLNGEDTKGFYNHGTGKIFIRAGSRSKTEILTTTVHEEIHLHSAAEPVPLGDGWSGEREYKAVFSFRVHEVLTQYLTWQILQSRSYDRSLAATVAWQGILAQQPEDQHLRALNISELLLPVGHFDNEIFRWANGHWPGSLEEAFDRGYGYGAFQTQFCRLLILMGLQVGMHRWNDHGLVLRVLTTTAQQYCDLQIVNPANEKN